MANYRYTAYDSKGKLKKGKVQATGTVQAADSLALQGLVVVDMKEISDSVNKRKSRPLSLEEHETFCRSLSSYLKAGLPLVESLRLLERQGGRKFGVLYGNLRKSVEGGVRLSTSMRDSSCFNDNICSMVESGERGGSLETVLEQAVSLFAMQVALRRKLQGAMTYPIVMVCVGMGVVGFLMAYVVPKVAVLFSDMGKSLPLSTQILMAISSFVRGAGLPILVIILILFLLSRTGRIRIKIPLFRGVMDKITLSMVASNLATLLRSGIPLVQALKMSAVLDPRKERWLSIADQVKGGLRFEKALEKDGSFDEDLVYFVRVGEIGGDLAGALEQVAANYWEISKAKLDRIANLIEPIMVLFLGVIVGFVVIAILVPIFNISSFVK